MKTIPIDKVIHLAALNYNILEMNRIVCYIRASNKASKK